MNIVFVIVGVFSLFTAQMAYKNNKIPSDLGAENGTLSSVPRSPNAVSSQSDDPEKKVNPFPYKNSTVETKQAVLNVLEKYGKIKIITNNKNYIHAVSKSGVMRYKDDLEFYFDEKLQVVHFRSASRIGYSDMGLNRKRYNILFDLYQKE